MFTGVQADKKIAGVCRIILEPDRVKGEFAIAISDDCHGEGIGYSLLKQCLNAAEDMGVKQVIGVVLTENTQMKMLGKKLGFSVKKAPDSREYELTIDLNQNDSDETFIL